MSEKSIRYIVGVIKTGLFILPALSLYIAGSFFFPFVTGKNFFFRIVIEVLFFLWVFVMVFNAKYRPRITALLLSLSAVLLFLGLATIFGENSYRSFWSNYERMEGLITHIHLFLYFLILTSVFQSKKDWKRFFGAMLGVSIVMVIYGFLQFFGKAAVHQSDVRLDASFGNSGYLAIFLIFHLFLTSMFFIWFKNRWVRAGLVVLFILQSFIVFCTATRGAILGLVGSLFLFAILVATFSKNRKVRFGFLGVLIVLVILGGLLMLFKDNKLIKDNYVLGRIASISFAETTVESRLTIWGMSFRGFQEHPILGWGPGNYNLVFNKYFEPKLYKQEPWFDRSHNIIFDWLISSGVLGLVSYLGIFAAALYLLRKGFKNGNLSIRESFLGIALFAAYFFHNLFVFDNLTSYFMFFSVLGFIHSSSFKREKESDTRREIGLLSYLVVTLVFCFVIFFLYFANVKPIMAAKNLLHAISLTRQNAPVDMVLKKFDEVFSYNTFGSGEAREQLSGYANMIVNASNVSQQDKIKVLTKAIEQMELQVEAAPKQTRYRIFLGVLYTRAGRTENALQSFYKALELSPKKQQVMFALADAYLASSQNEKAFEIVKTAYELDTTYSEAGLKLASVAIVTSQEYTEKVFADLEEIFGPNVRFNERFTNAYAKIGNYEKVKEIWQYLVEKKPDNLQYRVNLAATYIELEERDKAIKELEEIIKIEPSFKEQGEHYINEIRAGRNP